MNIPKKDFKTPEEYLEFVDTFVALLEKQFDLFEEKLSKKNGIQEVIWQLPALISLVNTVGYLRGQDGLFFEVRPITHGPNSLYAYEDYFEQRLNIFIETVLNSEERDGYLERLDEYYVKARGQKKLPSLEVSIDII